MSEECRNCGKNCGGHGDAPVNATAIRPEPVLQRRGLWELPLTLREVLISTGLGEGDFRLAAALAGLVGDIELSEKDLRLFCLSQTELPGLVTEHVEDLLNRRYGHDLRRTDTIGDEVGLRRYWEEALESKMSPLGPCWAVITHPACGERLACAACEETGARCLGKDGCGIQDPVRMYHAVLDAVLRGYRRALDEREAELSRLRERNLDRARSLMSATGRRDGP